MEIILSIAYVMLFVSIIRKASCLQVEGIKITWLTIGFLTKVLFGVSIGLIYTYYYTDKSLADTFILFEDSKIIFNTFQSDPKAFLKMVTGIGGNGPELQGYYNSMNKWFDVYSPINDNRIMIRLNTLLRFVSFGYYYVHVVFMSFISYCGVLLLIKVFQCHIRKSTTLLFVILFIWPSFSLWTSSLLKDSLAFFILNCIIYVFDKKLINENRFSKYMIIFALLLFALMQTKFQIFLLTVPLLLAWALSHKTRINAMVVFPAALIVSICIIQLGAYAIPKLNLWNFLSQKQSAFYDLASRENAGSVIHITELHPNLLSILTNLPSGLFNSLFRPFINDPGPNVSIYFGIENLAIVLLIGWNILAGRKSFLSMNGLYAFCFFYAVSYLAIIGMVTPVLGSLVRYKSQALPLLLLWSICLSNRGNLKMLDFLKKQEIN